MATGTMTKTTRENIAACAAHGFYFWSDHPDTATLWATDDSQRFHMVRVHRKTGKAEHSCNRYDGFTDHCTGTRGRVIAYDIPEGLNGAALLMGLTEDELVVDRPHKAETIDKLKAALRRHSPDYLMAELDRIIASRKTREVVLAGINHDPSWLIGFTTEELTDALPHTPHAEAVRAELQRRKEAS